jgi:hypothetical protein
MGVPCVWIIDPTSRTGRQCIGAAWTAAGKFVVPGTRISVDLSKLFADLDEEQELRNWTKNPALTSPILIL